MAHFETAKTVWFHIFKEETVLLIFLKYSSHCTLEHMVCIWQMLSFFPLLSVFSLCPHDFWAEWGDLPCLYVYMSIFYWFLKCKLHDSSTMTPVMVTLHSELVGKYNLALSQVLLPFLTVNSWSDPPTYCIKLSCINLGIHLIQWTALIFRTDSLNLTLGLSCELNCTL